MTIIKHFYNKNTHYKQQFFPLWYKDIARYTLDKLPVTGCVPELL